MSPHSPLVSSPMRFAWRTVQCAPLRRPAGSPHPAFAICPTTSMLWSRLKAGRSLATRSADAACGVSSARRVLRSWWPNTKRGRRLCGRAVPAAHGLRAALFRCGRSEAARARHRPGADRGCGTGGAQPRSGLDAARSAAKTMRSRSPATARPATGSSATDPNITRTMPTRCCSRKRLQPALRGLKRTPPYRHQTTDFTCGPACLMMALAWAKPQRKLEPGLEFRLWREATTIFMTAGHGGCGPYDAVHVCAGRRTRARGRCGGLISRTSAPSDAAYFLAP